jgi:cytochrome b6-f complex iron-sulfur subunit
MTTEAKAALPLEPRELSRRAFFTRLGLGSLGVATAGTLIFYYQYLSPNVLFEASPIVDEGKAENFPLDSVTLDVNAGIYLVHVTEGFFSLNAICTHLGCMTTWKQDEGVIACPCHGSRFSREGQKIAGPAPKPLPWLKTWLNDDGNLMVDRSATIPSLQFLRV